MWRVRYLWQQLPTVEKVLLTCTVVLLFFAGGLAWRMRLWQKSAPVFQEAKGARSVDWNPQSSIVVDVSGKVARPGVVHLPRGARLGEAIQKAGGTLTGADASKLNMAQMLRDGQHVRVGETAPKSTFEAESRKININVANLLELQNLPGVGPKTAQQIIAYRHQNGRFKNVRQLANVPGIGQGTLRKLEPLITVY